MLEISDLPRKFTALVTPFDAAEQVNYDGLRKNVNHQIECGWAPLVLGTTGEAPTIESDEFKKIVQTVVEETNGRMPVMVGTGSNSTRATFQKTEIAKELGADLALIVMPYYNKPEPAGQLAHFSAAAKVMPIVMYDVKVRTAREIDFEVTKQLAEHPNVVGYKAATHELVDGAVLSEKVARELSSDSFRVWSGDDGRTLSLMKDDDAYGVISVASNVCPEQLGEMIDAAANRDDGTAVSLNNKLGSLFRVLFIESNPIPVKAAMNLRAAAGYSGMNADYYRLPMTPPRETTINELRKVLSNLDLI